MRKLHRTAAPEVLQQFSHELHTWATVQGADKELIREALDAFQHHRCAYCDGWRSGNHHIEHFRRKGQERNLTFVWQNLFVSCGPGGAASLHCGGYKDRQHYDVSLLLKPDEDDPQKYLHFTLNGHVAPRPGLGPIDTRRAEVTIEVFYLNQRVLQGKRRREAERLLAPLNESRDEEFQEMCWDDIASEIKSHAQHLPYLAIWLDALADRAQR